MKGKRFGKPKSHDNQHQGRQRRWGPKWGRKGGDSQAQSDTSLPPKPSVQDALEILVKAGLSSSDLESLKAKMDEPNEQPKEVPAPRDPLREAQSLRDRISHLTKRLPVLEEKANTCWAIYCEDQDKLNSLKKKISENQELLDSLTSSIETQSDSLKT